MRCALWPDEPPAELESELDAWTSAGETAVFVADPGDGALVGFVEVAIHANAPGCVTDRIGFLEGWYVDPLFRRQGIGSALNAVAEAWARDRGCAEMASDTTEEYPASPAAHRGVGFTQVDSFNFAKRLI
jgi:aminoglycoside 6'-N-acetyltransferase I